MKTIKATDYRQPAALNPHFGQIVEVSYDPELVEEFDTRGEHDMMSCDSWGKYVELNDGRMLTLVSHGYRADGYTSTDRNFISGDFEPCL